MAQNEIEALLERIQAIEQISNEEWIASLNDRKTKELAFHDEYRARNQGEGDKTADTYEKFYGNKKYYTATKRSAAFVNNWIARESGGKIFLDYACGNGGYAIYAASQGAALSLGLDLSGVSVQNAKTAAAERGFAATTRFFQADAENTKLPDSSIDVIICSGMLHHLDLSHALPELCRILKPGGRVLAVEALDYNPAIKLYRALTPEMRTEWEKAHILTLSDVEFASRFFNVEDVRYWHVCGYLGGKLPRLAPYLDRIDRFLERIPYIQRLAWMFTFVLCKRSVEMVRRL